MTQLELGERLYGSFFAALTLSFIASEVAEHGGEYWLAHVVQMRMEESLTNPAICPIFTPQEIAHLIAYYALTHEFERRHNEDD